MLLLSYIFLYKIPSHEGGFLAKRQDFWQKDRNCCNKKILENFFVQFLVLYHQTNLTDPVHHTSLDIYLTQGNVKLEALHDTFLQHIYILKERQNKKDLHVMISYIF